MLTRNPYIRLRMMVTLVIFHSLSRQSGYDLPSYTPTLNSPAPTTHVLNSKLPAMLKLSIDKSNCFAIQHSTYTNGSYWEIQF